MKNIFKITIMAFLLILTGLIVIASDIVVKQGDLTINKLTANNVGIGTPSPRSKLTVATGTAGDSGIIEFRLGSNDASARDLIIRKDTTAPYGTSFISAANPTVDSGTFRFYTSDRAAGERMVIVSNGNVGIGTTSPTAKLYVTRVDTGWAEVVENSYTGDSGSGLLVKAGDNVNDVSFAVINKDNTATYLKVMGDGKVGIGISPSGAKLHVNGNLKVTSTTPGNLAGTQLCIGSDNVICKCGSCK